jgi:hypothetical protein
MLNQDYGIPKRDLVGGLQNQPANTNLTAPTNFKLILPKIPNTVYFCTSVSLPGQTCEPIIYKTFGANVKIPGNIVRHGDLSFTFLIDEKFDNVTELQNWFSSMLAFKDFDNLDKTKDWLSNEGQLIFLSNKKVPVLRMTFRGLFPGSISPITLKTTDTESANLTAVCTLPFSYYELEQL